MIVISHYHGAWLGEISAEGHLPSDQILKDSIWAALQPGYCKYICLHQAHQLYFETRKVQF